MRLCRIFKDSGTIKKYIEFPYQVCRNYLYFLAMPYEKFLQFLFCGLVLEI